MDNIAVLHVWTQNYSQNVGTCPGLSFQFLTRNMFFQNERPEPPLTFCTKIRGVGKGRMAGQGI